MLYLLIFGIFLLIFIALLIINALVNMKLSIENITIDNISIMIICFSIGIIGVMLKKSLNKVRPTVKSIDNRIARDILKTEKGSIVSSFFFDLVRVNKSINPHILVDMTHKLE